MVYIIVLFGSFFGICAILGMRVALRHRSVRRFVRSVKQRSEAAQERGLHFEETPVERPHKNSRASAVELQKLRILLRESETSSARGNFDDTEKLLIQALTVSPASIEARAQLAKLYLQTQREAKAEALYRELIVECDDVSFFANLGLSCYRLAKYEDARSAYAAALERDAKNPERIAALGRASMAAGYFQEAAALMEKASERLARDTELLHVLAECYERLGDALNAQETYRRIHRLQPYDEDVKEKISALAGV